MSNRTSRVLIVDDEPQIVRALRSGLRASGYEVLSAFDGEGALTSIIKDAPDVMILDLGLPDSAGLETFKRASTAMPDTAILILSGTDDSGLALTAVAAGAQDYLVKGATDGAVLAKAISFAIERKALERQARAGERPVVLAQSRRSIPRRSRCRRQRNREGWQSHCHSQHYRQFCRK